MSFKTIENAFENVNKGIFNGQDLLYSKNRG